MSIRQRRHREWRELPCGPYAVRMLSPLLWYRGLDGNAEDVASVAVEGSFLALFDPDKYRTTDKEERKIEKLIVVIEGADESRTKKRQSSAAE